MTPGTRVTRQDRVDASQLVLVIDDGRDVRRTLLSHLRENRIEVISAADGQNNLDVVGGDRQPPLHPDLP